MVLWEVVLVTLVAATVGTSEVPAEQSSDTDLIQEEDVYFDTWNTAIERAKEKSCDAINGTCILKKDAWKSCEGAIDMRYGCAKKHVCCSTDISEIMTEALKKEFQQFETKYTELESNIQECNSMLDYIIEQIEICMYSEVPIARSAAKPVPIYKDFIASRKGNGKSCDYIGGNCLSKKKALKSCKGVIDRTYECKNDACCITDTSVILVELLKKEVEYWGYMQELLIANLKECNSQLNYTMNLLATATCSSTTAEPSSTVDSTTDASVPAGFERFNGRVIRRTLSSDPKFNYDDAMSFCDRYSAKPFIPRLSADYQLYKDVRNGLGRYGLMWLPADDRLQEGVMRWYNGELTSSMPLWDWHDDQELFLNDATRDCLWYGLTHTKGPVVYLMLCDHDNYKSYPPICEKI